MANNRNDFSDDMFDVDNIREALKLYAKREYKELGKQPLSGSRIVRDFHESMQRPPEYRALGKSVRHILHKGILALRPDVTPPNYSDPESIPSPIYEGLGLGGGE